MFVCAALGVAVVLLVINCAVFAASHALDGDAISRSTCVFYAVLTAVLLLVIIRTIHDCALRLSDLERAAQRLRCFLLDLALAKEQGKHKKVVAEKAEAVKSDSDEDAQHVKEKKEASFSADSLFADAPGPASYAPPVPLSQKSGISAADSVYIIACTGLVQFMTPGLALFYGGPAPLEPSGRSGSVYGILQQCFSFSSGFRAIGRWYAVGFSLSSQLSLIRQSICFGSGVVVGSPMDFPFWVGVSKHEPWPATHLSKELFATFQMMFAVIAPILMTGAFADRMRFGPYLIFICVWSILVYFPWVHMIWGGGFFQTYGVWDFAGGIALPGWSALATALALGPRKAKVEGKDLGEPHNVPIVVVGTGILWFGWFGFNGGSALAMNATATTAVTNSHLAAASAVCVWGAIDWMRE
ncbi:unnamed protein product, partial [Polarella glacialis]